MATVNPQVEPEYVVVLEQTGEVAYEGGPEAFGYAQRWNELEAEEPTGLTATVLPAVRR